MNFVLLIVLAAQVPPTPTAFPTPNATQQVFQVPRVSLWDFTDEAIQAYNWVGDGIKNQLGAILLLIFIIYAAFMFVRWMRKYTSRSGEE